MARPQNVSFLLMASQRRVLVVDDIPANRIIAEAMLRQLGWTVATASDGREALRALGASPFDLVLLDISMPGISGMEVCQSIRNNEALANLPVIAYTAHAQPEDRRNFIASGFNDVLIKPVSRETLASSVADVMQYVS